MDSIARITLKEFTELENPEDFEFAIRYAHEFRTEEDVLGIGDVTELEFGTVKDIQQLIESGGFGLLEQIEALHSITGRDLAGEKLDEVCRTCSYLLGRIVDLLNKESAMLAGRPPTQEQEMAGLSNFNKLGVYMQLRQLADNDVTKIESVRRVKYSAAFIELYTRKLEHEYAEDYREITKPKPQH